MILATWLSEAATEEQTSVLLVILKVLEYVLHVLLNACISLYNGVHIANSCKLILHFQLFDYLPVSKALPGHMSAILQSVNKLRFYRVAGVFCSFSDCSICFCSSINVVDAFIEYSVLSEGMLKFIFGS